jgi:hypothetical protein
LAIPVELVLRLVTGIVVGAAHAMPAVGCYLSAPADVLTTAAAATIIAIFRADLVGPDLTNGANLGAVGSSF